MDGSGFLRSHSQRQRLRWVSVPQSIANETPQTLWKRSWMAWFSPRSDRPLHDSMRLSDGSQAGSQAARMSVYDIREMRTRATRSLTPPAQALGAARGDRDYEVRQFG